MENRYMEMVEEGTRKDREGRILEFTTITPIRQLWSQLVLPYRVLSGQQRPR